MGYELPFYYHNPNQAVILCGIPTSGKTTWSLYISTMIHNFDPNAKIEFISRDMARLELYGGKYKFNQEDEDFVTKYCNVKLQEAIRLKKYIIVDNTHCKESYLQGAIEKFKDTGYSVKVEFFDIPLWKAYYRNIKRYLKDGKWIPFKVIRNMKRNYDKINKLKYNHGHLL